MSVFCSHPKKATRLHRYHGGLQSGCCDSGTFFYLLVTGLWGIIGSEYILRLLRYNFRRINHWLMGKFTRTYQFLIKLRHLGFCFFWGFFSLQIGSIDLFHQTKVISEIATALFSFANIRNFLWKNEESHNWSN